MARLLIVDEEESLCRILEIAFRKDGHTVESVSTGQVGKEKIESGVYDVIISDIRLSDITGLELLELAHATKKRVPFILMTAVPTVSSAVQAVNLRAYRYVIKSESLVEDLRSIVEGALKEQTPPS